MSAIVRKINVDLEPYQLLADQSIGQLVSPEDLKRTTRLSTNYFDPSLWRELTQTGATWHHEYLLHEKITPGHLWIQKGLQGSIIHWSEGKTIHRASLLENEVLVSSYSIENGVPQTLNAKMPPEDFRDLLSSYLKSDGVRPRKENPKWDAFIRKLELVKIDCCISRTASEKFHELDKLFPLKRLGVCVNFQVVKEGKSNETIMEISKTALRACVTQTLKAKDEVNSLAVGPTLRSFEALDQAIAGFKNGAPFSDHHRAVVSAPKASRQMGDLVPVLQIKMDGNRAVYPFKVNRGKSQSGETKFLLTIDYADQNWILESTYYEPVIAEKGTS